MRSGLCRPHTNEERRAWFARDEKVRRTLRERVHARKRGLDPMPGWAQIEIREEFGGRCGYCRQRPATTWDHAVPISKGGRTTPGNVVPACVTCNSSKRDRDLDEWLDEKGYAYSEELANRLILAHAGLYG